MSASICCIRCGGPHHISVCPRMDGHLIYDKDKRIAELERERDEARCELAEERAHRSSSTFEDLVQLCPAFAARLQPHEWDNLTPSEQRDRVLANLTDIDEARLEKGAVDV